MDRFQSMQVYVTIVERGSFTQAAEALQLHRPAVTKAIQDLEEELGIRLLNRTTRKVTATADGEDFYRRCVEVLNGVSETFSDFSRQRISAKGRLRLDIAATLARAIVIPALPEFQEKFPDIEIVIGASDQPVDLVNAGIDCVLRLGELKDSSLIAKQIGLVPMVTCAAPTYVQRYGTPNSLEDLRNHKAVNFFSGANRKIVEWSFKIDGQQLALKLDSGILTDDSEAFLGCGLAGIGLLQGVRPSLQPFIDSGRLVEILPGFHAAPKPISIMYPNRDHLPLRVRIFIDWLTELIHHHFPA